jgi:hypothetical protein
MLVGALACDRRIPSRDSTSAAATPQATASPKTVASAAQATAPSGDDADDSPPWLDSLLVPGARFDSAGVDTVAAGVTCYTFPRYVVVVREPRDSLGSDVFVRQRRIPDAAPRAVACGADSIAGDFVVRNHWAEYYTGLFGRVLILDSGTGPAREVILYDVDARRHIATFGGGVAGWRDSVTLMIWRAGGDSVSRTLCPHVPESLGASADSLMSLDVRSGAAVWAGRWRCAVRQ